MRPLSGMVIVLSLAASGWGPAGLGARPQARPAVTVAAHSTSETTPASAGQGQASRTLAVVVLSTWEQGTSRSAQSMLMERVLATGRPNCSRQTRSPNSAWPRLPLASCAFAARGRSGLELVAVRRQRAARAERSLAAQSQRADLGCVGGAVGVLLNELSFRHMRTGHEWVAAQMSRCRRGRCYRIDSVTLADKGVVFGTRGDRAAPISSSSVAVSARKE